MLRTSIYNADYEHIYVSILKAIINFVPVDVIVASLKNYHLASQLPKKKMDELYVDN